MGGQCVAELAAAGLLTWAKCPSLVVVVVDVALSGVVVLVDLIAEHWARCGKGVGRMVVGCGRFRVFVVVVRVSVGVSVVVFVGVFVGVVVGVFVGAGHRRDAGAGGRPGGQNTLAWLDEQSRGGKTVGYSPGVGFATVAVPVHLLGWASQLVSWQAGGGLLTWVPIPFPSASSRSSELALAFSLSSRTRRGDVAAIPLPVVGG